MFWNGFLQSAKMNCKEEYIEVDFSNVKCAKDHLAISECTARINEPHILEPECPSDVIAPNSLDNNRKYFLETHEDHRLSPAEFPQFGCRVNLFHLLSLGALIYDYNCYLCKVWANDIIVQKALHVRKGTVREWVRCNNSLLCDKDIESAVGYHLYLNTKDHRALIYRFFATILCPLFSPLFMQAKQRQTINFFKAVMSCFTSGTESWTKSLDFSIVVDWRPWFVEGQVARYSRV
ncbi:serine carboxypeptidase-like 18 [Durio zibethinus]|uniref:Serine carboxypeptidase-like 18 n=1 Tax=Durio zibethinus TaxID=66656 RepID=A0A6P6BAK1_DURZI|nr:serine carboxypeptidase-like 18 [Durio zibethinus]